MLNPTFSKKDQAKILASYVAPIEIANCTLLGNDEVRLLNWAISIDSILNRILPQRCFGSICLVCQR